MIEKSHSLAVAEAAMAVLLALGVAFLATQCGGSTVGLPTQADFAAYTWAQGSCLQSQSTQADTIACVRGERLAWCSRFPAVCTDGGAK